MIKELREWFHRGEKICDICGKWVKDVEVPLHTTHNGGTYVHPMHIIMGQEGKDLLNQFSKWTDEEISIRSEGPGARRI